ncbi:MAG TPA: sugar phosphate isomerase/epimerase family protein [Armatimonadota bacterium]|jgi:sugar phosphate isomerase/epimerase
MDRPTNRRLFLTHTVAGALGALGGLAASRPAAAMEPVKRVGRAPLRLSCAAYSFRQWLTGANKSMDLEQFIDKAAEMGVDAVELTSYYFPTEITPEYLNRIKRRCFLQGLDVSSTSVGNAFTLPAGPARDKEIAHVKQWVDYAADFGAPVIRVFAGTAAKDQTEEDARKNAIECMEIALEHAAKRGVFLGLENHGGIVTTAEQLLSIVKAIQSDWFGVNLDTGNFRSADPYKEMEQVAPYAVTVQVKTELTPAGQRKQLGDLPREIGILRKAGYRGYVVLEYEAAEDAMVAVPRILGEMRKLLG